MMKPRSSERVRAFLGAQILFNNHNSTVDCQIRNISAGGAKLLVSSTVSVPQEFELSVPQKGRTFRCRLRWRIQDAVGVEFLDAASAYDLQAAVAAERVRSLETENEGLRRQVADLSARLISGEPGGPDDRANQDV